MDMTIRIAGAAGQGMQTTAELLGRVLLRSGYFVTSHTDAESRIRGGLNFSQVRLSDNPVAGVRENFDILIAHTQKAAEEFADSIREPGLLMGFSSSCHKKAAPIDLDDLAKQAGSLKASGVVALGAVCKLLGLGKKTILEVIKEHFASRPELSATNEQAVIAGFGEMEHWSEHPVFSLGSPPGEQKNRLLLYGHQAISLGALAGGVSFVAGYPMSPATSILADLAAWSEDAGIVVEQAEDEIAAINMLAGASYAGARSMTATSGGGFCLMTEGVSLLGMIETPGVIVIAQRPGPATGLPTKTAQGDLNLVLHAGHGFFPRIILSPATVEDGFEITAKAFDLAERFQVPVFVLTDQLLQDSQSTVGSLDTSSLPTNRHLLSGEHLESMNDYKRFSLTPDGISPMAAPGSSQHVVVVDSDEHDERGHLSESRLDAQKMSKKRLRKADTIRVSSPFAPAFSDGLSEDRPLVLSWGSTYSTITEVRKNLLAQHLEFAHLHLRQLWPLDESRLEAVLKRPKSITVVENNPDGQLAGLLKSTGLRAADNVITRHDGRPFTVEDLNIKLKELTR